MTLSRSWTPRLLEAASHAPAAPGVYFFLDGDRRLLYIGKATDLRQRLRQHARVEPISSGRLAGRVKARYPLVRHVRWEEAATEALAAAREADLIVALRPPDNASTDTGTWQYLVMREADGPDRWVFELQAEPPGDGAVVYGCFPHLGKGVMFLPAIACSDGYTALLRLLWSASGDGAHVPSRIARSAPARFETRVAPARLPRLRRLLGGTSDLVLDDLLDDASGRDAYLLPALRRDRDAAAGFFEHGPRALRRLRRRHDRPAGVLTRRDIEQLLTDEVTEILDHG